MTGKVRGWGARAGVTLGVIGIAVAAAVAVSPDGRNIALADTPIGAGGEYHPVTSERVLDTRLPLLDTLPYGRKPSNSLSAGVPFEIDVLGKAGLPEFVDLDDDGYDDHVLAVAVSIIAVSPTRIGYIRAFPTGAAEGDTSVVNFLPGSVVSNSAVIRPGLGGTISIRLVTPEGPGLSDVVVDVSGWFSTSSPDNVSGARLIPISPIRAYDSGLAKFGAKLIGRRAQIEVPIWGAVDASSPSVPVPDDANIVGVVVNVTGENAYPGGRATYLSALREPVAAGAKPATSTVNLLPGEVRANLAILPVDANGSIHVFNLDGELRIVVDIMGYLVAGRPVASVEGRVIPLVAPFRVFDTRQTEFMAQPLGPARAEDWSFNSFVNDVNISGQPVGAQTGLLGNLTATNLRRQYPWAPVASFMTAYPSPGAGGDTTPPRISNLNVTEGVNVPNLTLLTYGGDIEDPFQLRFYNRAGYIDYLLDVYAVVLAADPVTG